VIPGGRQFDVAVRAADTRRECAEYALVLRTAGIPSDICVTPDGFALLVAARDAERAMAELDAYADENAPEPPPAEPLPDRGGGWSGVFAYAAVLIIVAYLRERHSFPTDWSQWGQTDAGLIRAGQWWRTVTALTLHVDGGHLIGNVFFGALFGLFVGKRFGAGLAWLSILVAGAMGNFLNAWVQPPEHTSIGASTAVFGALGMLTADALIWRRRTAAGPGQRWVPLVGGVVLLGYLGTGGIRTDVIAHVTGFLSGIGLGALYGRMGRRLNPSRPTQIALGSGACVIISGCWLLALWSSW